jgi:hypothetical protein
LKKYEKDNNFSLICIIVVGLIIASGLETISLRTNRDLTEELPITYDNYAGLGWQGEYLPAKTYYHLDYYNVRGNDIIIKSGNCNINKNFDNAPKLEFTVENIKEETTIELPRLFYYGYELKNIDTGEQISLIENENGFIEAKIDKNGVYQLDYKGLPIINAYKIDLIIIIILIVVFFIIKRTYKNKERKK